MFTVTIAGTIVPATKVRVTKTLNDIPTATFEIPNIATYRSLIGSDETVNISYRGQLIFIGLLTKPEFHDDKLRCTSRDLIASKMERILYNRLGEYDVSWEDTRYDSILADICDVAGISYGPTAPGVPAPNFELGFAFLAKSRLPNPRVKHMTDGGDPDASTNLSSTFGVVRLISVRFNHATCLYAAQVVCDLVGLDWWTTASEFFSGIKGTARGSVSEYALGAKKEDREKLKNRVIMEGYDVDNQPITIVKQDNASIATYGLRETSFVEKNASDAATLDHFAEQKLDSLKDPIVTIPISLPTPTAMKYSLDTGDTVDIVDERKDMGSLYRIKKCIFEMAGAKLTLEHAERSISRIIRSVQNADPTVLPSYTGADVGGAYSGVTTVSPGSRTVAAKGAYSATGFGIVTGAWLDTGCVLTVPSDDHDILLCHVYYAMYSGDATTTWGARIYVAIKDETDNTWYPSDTYSECPLTGGIYYFAAGAGLGAGEAGHTCFITIPKNVKGHSLRVYFYPSSETGDCCCWVRLTVWGHSPHTHPIADFLHINPLEDTTHINPQTDKRRSHG